MASCSSCFCLIIMAISPIISQGQEINKLRRYYAYDGVPMIRKPMIPEDLPRAEPIHPGHTLLRPDRTTLKSAAKFPLRSSYGKLVYGNLDNLGITYDNDHERVKYTSFRKHDTLLDSILNAVDKTNKNGKNPGVIVIGPFSVKKDFFASNKNLVPLNGQSSEIWDGTRTDKDELSVRRAHKVKHKQRDRHNLISEVCNKTTSSSSASDSEESDFDKNPGNPYTIHRSKYKQNYLWNYEMDGNHMNINPYGPKFENVGAPGGEMFFGRNWWYFNQDDYLPLG